ncbi:MAG: hypothetical protein AVDCRST_MAG89-4244 [uncultured Gemmatimonadetes bacterium]|uniref:Uncharacterized protein n=1 Tax=uncultured Gemmatimonadota bacterium TaxID=203437 RepID=A0A6J4MSI7_9BACT|nr:MAG: hypothetical protein AVDCRST_MAG89-4244 [uncultured Gemmatimonadota bacterium]
MRPTEIFTREGILSVAVPADIAAAIAELYEDAAHEAVLETAALFLVRMGHERGAAQLRAWLAEDPGYLGAIPREVRRRLAFEPEAFLSKDAAR